MIKKDANQVFEELYHLQNCEMALGIYYQELAEHFPHERMFWEEAIGDMVNHARRVGELIARFASNQDRFRPGKYRVAVLETFLTGIYDHVQMIKQNALPPNDMLKIAFDYECSAIMNKPCDIVESVDRGFIEFKMNFADEVLEHSNRVKKYIEQKLGMQPKGSQTHLSTASL